MENCKICGIKINEDNCSYEDGYCNDCFENQCDEELLANQDED